MKRVVYACDVGSTRRNAFAWARIPETGKEIIAGGDIAKFVEFLVNDANNGLSISLGFECPLFLPVPIGSGDLSRGRTNEGNRSMFAPAGATVTTIGIHQTAWVLRSLREEAKANLEYSTDWNRWPPAEGKQTLLLWEAFVSGKAHGKTHEVDALTAANYFWQNESNLGKKHAVSAEKPLTLIHAVAIWSGWASELEGLHRECLVLRPSSAYRGKWTSA